MVTLIENKSLLDSNSDALVCTVNLVGVMGAGIAKAFKLKYPIIIPQYQRDCFSKNLDIGKITYYQVNPRQFAVCVPTKTHWRLPSEYDYVKRGLEAFCISYNKYNIQSVAFPPLGCGNGGLNRNKVIPMMEEYLSQLPIYVEIYV